MMFPFLKELQMTASIVFKQASMKIYAMSPEVLSHVLDGNSWSCCKTLQNEDLNSQVHAA